jgi:hypothetical protein
MRNSEHAARFDDAGETSGFGESLPLDRRHCLLISKLNGCACGACGQSIAIQSRPVRCANESCGQEWTCMVVTPGAPEIINPWLAIYSASALNDAPASLAQRSRRYRQRMGMSALEPDDPTTLP